MRARLGRPQTTKRKAKTILKIKNGRTVVIGGLIQSKYEKANNKIPLVSEIPVVGNLFKNKGTKEKRTNERKEGKKKENDKTKEK